MSRVLLAMLLTAGACHSHAEDGHGDHAHEGHDDHAHEGHDDHAHEGHEDHAHEGHDDHAREGHDDHAHKGHDDHGESTAFTTFADGTEAFVEVPALVLGKEAKLAVHLTWLSDYRPVDGGVVTVELSGGGGAPEQVEVIGAARPGIFVVTLMPQHAGNRELVVRLSAMGTSAVHRVGTVDVRGPEEHSHAPEAAPEPDGAISFLKEQQWVMDFGTATATTRPIRPSFEAYGTIRARADGQAQITAPMGGRILAGDTFPRLGADVDKGAVLARLAPRHGDAGDAAALEQAVTDARIALKHANHERERLDGLLTSGAVAEHQAVDARFAVQQARAALAAARRRKDQSQRLEKTEGAPADGDIEIRSPLGGTVVAVDVVPGTFVEEGQPMARIVDLDRLWLEVHVAEAHVSMLASPKGAWFDIEGFEGTFELDASQVVTTGGVLDVRSRTVPLIMALDNPGRRLRIGMFADVRVVQGDPREAVAIPKAAVLYEGGLPVAYVQHGGETFVRRPLRLGEVDGAWIEVREGLAVGERVVTRGAYAVRLAASAGQIPDHGHAH